MFKVNEAIELQPGDVLLFRTSGWGILEPLAELLLRYDHVAMYYGETKRGLPLIVESIGRGVLIRSLYCYDGWTLTVMRPARDDGLGSRAAEAAEHLADNPGSWYGYFDIPRYVLPKLILAKWGRVLPALLRDWLNVLANTYRENHLYICSELVADAYACAGQPLVSAHTIPLPDDLADSPALQLVGTFKVTRPGGLTPQPVGPCLSPQGG